MARSLLNLYTGSYYMQKMLTINEINLHGALAFIVAHKYNVLTYTILRIPSVPLAGERSPKDTVNPSIALCTIANKVI